MKFKGIIAAFLAVLIVFSAAACTNNGTGTNKPKTDEYSITDAALTDGVPSSGNCRVYYEIFVGSFSDSNGDGTGDLRGIINRMDYLNDGDPASGLSLGVEGLWLTPIFDSPSYHKYDITDYYKIDPSFGTEEDLKELVDLCHSRGAAVILDLPINHTGKKNDWFSEFLLAHRQGDTSSEFYDVYTWYDSNVEDKPAGRQFRPIAGTSHYYECNFSGDMPELNFDCEKAFELALGVAYHYLDLGVDGFRFDAAKYVYFGDHVKSVEFWNRYIGKLREKKEDVYTVGEVWDGEGVIDRYMAATDCFNFAVADASGLIAEVAKKGDANRWTGYVEGYLNKISGMREGARMTPFITNHDMDRAAGFLTVASGAMKMAANLYVLGPGTPFIYYGEEIGMRGSRGAANTDANRRLAMLWGDGDTVKNPVGSSYSEDNQIDTTVFDQLKDKDSLYNYYKKLIMIRRANPEIAMGTYRAVKIANSKVGCFISTYNGSSVMVLHNPSGASQTIDLSLLSDEQFTVLRAVIGMEDASLEGTMLTIGGQTSVVIGK